MSNSKFYAMLFLAIVVGFSSCKSKKKISGVANTKEVKNQIEEELNQDTEVVVADEDISSEPQVLRKVIKEPSKSQQLENYFSAIANAPNTADANNNINEALSLFSSNEVPVLIVIYRKDGTTDYDEPTTIKRYLEYLKDTGNTQANVEEMVFDDYGKVKELVLKK